MIAEPPQVSVIVCVYNGERFLSRTIDSVLAQTFSEFEMIVVDDGSTDASAALVGRYRDARIRLISQRNQGSAAALVTGIGVSRGIYIALIDQDDLWHEKKLAEHMDVHRKRPGVDLTFSWFQLINETGDPIGIGSRRYRGPVDFGFLLEDFVIAGSSNVVARREAIEKAGGPDPAIPLLCDMDLCLRIALLSPGNIEVVPMDLMLYRRHGSQITREVGPLEKEFEMVLEKMRRLAPREAGARASKARSNMSRYFARLEYENGVYWSGLRYVRAAFSDTPGYFLKDPRNWTTAAACLCGLALPRRLHRTLERMAGLHFRT